MRVSNLCHWTVSIAIVTAPVAVSAQQKTFTATEGDQATACAIVKRQAEAAAQSAVGVRVAAMSRCDCAKTAYDAYSPQGIALKSRLGTTTAWTCQATAQFERK
jgi:hypothetical protein